MASQGNPVPGCQNKTHNLDRICDYYERVFQSSWKSKTTWCPANNNRECCQEAVEEHYITVGQMATDGVHKTQKQKAELVSNLATEMGVTCEPLNLP